MERLMESFARNNNAQPILKRTRVDFMLYGAPLETTYNPDYSLRHATAFKIKTVQSSLGPFYL